MRWGGSLLEEARLHAPRLLLTSAPHAVAAEEVGGSVSVEPFAVDPDPADLVVMVRDHVAPAGGGISLADADVVVTGGRGVGSAEGFAIIEELASELSGAVGCSRAVTMSGWRPHTDQVGQTGTKIAPESTSRAASAVRPSTSPAARGQSGSSRSTRTRRRRSWPSPTTR